MNAAESTLPDLRRLVSLGRTALALLVGLFGLFAGAMQIAAAWRLRPDGSSLGTGKLPVFDFMNLWAGGALAREGHLGTLFDRAAYMNWLHANLSPFIDGSEWSYPPTMLLFGTPLSLLPINAAYLVWTLATLAGLALVLRAMGAAWGTILLCLIAPASLFNIMMGHNGAFTAALLLGGLYFSRERPVLAGVLLGLLTTKPQLGVLVPFCLLAAGSWRTIASACIATLLLALAVPALFDHAAWTQFLRVTQPMMTAIMEAPWPQGYMQNGVTVFWLARYAGAGLPLAYGVQGAVALVCIAAAVRIWRRADIARIDRTCLVVMLTPLATPYGYGYDLVGYSAALACIAMRHAPSVSIVAALAWTWPCIQRAAIRESGWTLGPVGALFVLAGLVYAWRLVETAAQNATGAGIAAPRPV